MPDAQSGLLQAVCTARVDDVAAAGAEVQC
jgi:hypothetical protein